MLVGAKYKSVWKLLASTHFNMEFELTEQVRGFVEQNKLQSGIQIKANTAKLTPEKARELMAVAGLFLHRNTTTASIKALDCTKQDWYCWLGKTESPFYDPAFVQAYEDLLEPELEKPEPDEENDIFITPSGPLGSLLSVSVEGKHFGEFPDHESADQAIRTWMDQHNFHPSIWFISDHGNISPYQLGD